MEGPRQSRPLSPEGPPSLINQACELIDAGDLEAAHELIGRDIAKNGGSKFSYYNRGLAFMMQGQNQQAIDDYTRALDIDCTLRSAFNNRGIVYCRTHQYEIALRDYESALRLNPSDPIVLYNLAHLHWELGRWAEASAAVTSAIESDPASAAAYHLRTVCESQMHQFAAALADAEKALSLDPCFSEAAYSKALALDNLGRAADARLAYKEYLLVADRHSQKQKIAFVRKRIGRLWRS